MSGKNIKLTGDAGMVVEEACPLGTEAPDDGVLVGRLDCGKDGRPDHDEEEVKREKHQQTHIAPGEPHRAARAR